MGAVVLDRARIDHAAAGEGQAGLALQPGNLVRDTKPQRVRAAAKPSRRTRIATSAAVTGPNAMRPCARCDLDHRLEPIQPARAGPDDLDRRCRAGRRPAPAPAQLHRRRRQPRRHRGRRKYASSSLRLRDQRIEARFVEPSDHAAVEHRRGRGRAQPEAVDRLQRHALIGSGVAEGDRRASLRRAPPAHRRPRPGRLRRGTVSAHGGRPARGGNHDRR